MTRVKVKLIESFGERSKIDSSMENGSLLIRSVSSFTISPLQTKTVRTGIAIKLPKGWGGHLRRYTHRKNLELLIINDTLDSGFRGEVFVIIKNLSFDQSLTILAGEPVAHLEIRQIPNVIFEISDSSINEFISDIHKRTNETETTILG